MNPKPYFSRTEALVKIHQEPVSHVKMAELKAALSPEHYKRLCRDLEGQTVVEVEGIGEPYPWDVENILIAIEQNRATTITD